MTGAFPTLTSTRKLRHGGHARPKRRLGAAGPPKASAATGLLPDLSVATTTQMPLEADRPYMISPEAGVIATLLPTDTDGAYPVSTSTAGAGAGIVNV